MVNLIGWLPLRLPVLVGKTKGAGFVKYEIGGRHLGSTEKEMVCSGPGGGGRVSNSLQSWIHLPSRILVRRFGVAPGTVNPARFLLN